VPDAPALLLAVNSNVHCAVWQSKKVAVAVPTTCVLGVNSGRSLPPITKHRRQVLDLAAKYLLPVVSIYRDYAEAGSPIAYGPSLNVVYRRAAAYVDMLLKREVASDLPVEQPTKFDLVINLKTAKALGITIPQAILLRADEVIQYLNASS
jgi:hypothetical protein